MFFGFFFMMTYVSIRVMRPNETQKEYKPRITHKYCPYIVIETIVIVDNRVYRLTRNIPQFESPK